MKHRVIVTFDSDALTEDEAVLVVRQQLVGIVRDLDVVYDSPQLSLLDYLDAVNVVTSNEAGLSHNRDHDTSRRAAWDNAPRSGSQRARVLLSLAHRASTDYELERLLNMKRPSPGNRRGELVTGGFVVDSGQRRPTDTGSLAIVWEVTDKGAAAAQALMDDAVKL